MANSESLTAPGRAFIPKYGIEIKLKGLNNLNRALNGDVVGIKLLPESGLCQISNDLS